MFQIKFHKNIYKNILEIFIISYDEKIGRRYFAQPLNLIFEEIKEGDMVKPTIEISSFMAEDFLRAWADALKEYGIIKKETTEINEALEATRYHLEDLRQLLQLKPYKTKGSGKTKKCDHK